MKVWAITWLVLATAGMVPQALWAAANSAALYRQHCAVCHGEQGDGQSRARYGLNPPPRNFTTAAAWDELTDERMRTSISYGRPGSAMTAWKQRLTAAQIDGLVAYIRTSFMHPPSAASVDAGARLYKKHCAACHGDHGNGAQWTRNSLNPAPRDFTAAQAKTELSRERMINSVTYGRPGTAMMSFRKRLSAAEIETVVNHVRTTFMKVEPAAPAAATDNAVPPADMSLAFPHGLIGDVLKGRQFYLENCYTCHGKKGDGQGPRADFNIPRPRNFIGADARRTLNRPALFLAVSRGKPGTVMPAWNKVLDDQQIADVAEYVFQAFIRADAAAERAVKKKALN